MTTMPIAGFRAAVPNRTDVEISVRVSRRSMEAEGTVALALEALGGVALPPWAPGAHIDILTKDGSARQYSLCGDPNESHAWRVAILREERGRNGSQWLHDSVGVGDVLVVRGPRNHFRLDHAPAYLFIAGGIGITPILPMLREAEHAGADYHLVYGGRSRDTMAFLPELERHGARVEVRPQSEFGLLDLEAILRIPKPGTLIYCCGPEPLLAAVEEHAKHWPKGALRLERFSPVARAPSSEGDSAFEVELARSGTVLLVPADQTLLSVLEDAGADVVSSCGEGTCGSCQSTVLKGEPDHRDSVLTEAERAAGDSIMVCVSRCKGVRLTLDL